jgi:hypothetical protein
MSLGRAVLAHQMAGDLHRMVAHSAGRNVCQISTRRSIFWRDARRYAELVLHYQWRHWLFVLVPITTILDSEGFSVVMAPVLHTTL